MNLTFEQQGLVRTSAEQSAEKSDRTLLDVYAAYKHSKDLSVRLTVVNLLARDEYQTLRYVGATLDERTSSQDRRFRTVRLSMDLKL